VLILYINYIFSGIRGVINILPAALSAASQNYSSLLLFIFMLHSKSNWK